MLTRIQVRNFKRFDDVEIELGGPVVFVGPNNSGKTSALQALALWDYGIRRWIDKRGAESKATVRTGVTINRRELLNLPIPVANLLWHQRNTRSVQRVEGKQHTANIRIEIVVDGVTDGKNWSCGVEFDYANEESFYVRPLRLNQDDESTRMAVPETALQHRLAYLPPMSGLSATEDRLDEGAVNVRIGEGRTAEVLRNLCHQVHASNEDGWNEIVECIREMFKVELRPPDYVAARGQISMSYVDEIGTELDLSSAGRGLQQTLLILSYLELNPGAVLLIDEPDAHLEILRQREIYSLLTRFSQDKGSQVILATHSEVILTEARKDLVVAFVGKPHAVSAHHNLMKALRDIPFHQYLQAEERGWVLYLEGPTDLACLQTFAEIIGHDAAPHLRKPFVRYVGNNHKDARSHFDGLREAFSPLKAVALYDRLEVEGFDQMPGLNEIMWSRREIENYLAFPEALARWVRAYNVKDITRFDQDLEQIMDEIVQDLVPKVALKDRKDKWWLDTKMSDDFLDRVFAMFFEKLGLPNVMRKKSYYELARYVPKDLIAPEVAEKLDAILETASSATPGPPAGAG